MLGKLIKYDFRSCWKKFWPLWTTIIVLAAVNAWSALYCEQHSNFTFFVGTLPKLVIFGVGVAAVVLAFSYIYEEFAHGLLGRQGYLMFTLPVREETLISSKGIVAVVLEALSTVTVFLSLAVFLLILEPEMTVKTVKDIVIALRMEHAAGPFILLLLVLIIFAAMTAVTFNLHIYTAAAVGHLSPKYRQPLFVIVFIVLCVLSVNLMVYAAVPIVKAISFAMEAEIESVGVRDMIRFILFCSGAMILLEALYSAVLFFITARILKTRLNLE